MRNRILQLAALVAAVIGGASPAMAQDACARLGIPGAQCTVENVAGQVEEVRGIAIEAQLDNAAQDQRLDSLEARMQKVEQKVGGESVGGVCRDLQLQIVTGLYDRSKVSQGWVDKCKAAKVDLDQRPSTPTTTPPATTGTPGTAAAPSTGSSDRTLLPAGAATQDRVASAASAAANGRAIA